MLTLLLSGFFFSNMRADHLKSSSDSVSQRVDFFLQSNVLFFFKSGVITTSVMMS